MTVLLDTNILVSFLLSPNRTSPIYSIVSACFLGLYMLVLPQEVLDELVETIQSRPHLCKRITPTQAEELVNLLRQVAENISPIPEAIPHVTRDPKDDYLLAYALVGEVDYLVTGDDDLLSLGQVEQVQIVTPRAFQEILEKR